MAIFEWLNANTSSIASDVGLAGNDVTAFYPLLAIILCFVYFLNNKQEVIGDYFQGEEEFQKSHDVKVVAQMGLRFETSIADKMGVYNESTPGERDNREKEFINFIKIAQQQFNMKKTPMLVETEIVQSASKSEADELPQQKTDVHNADCEQNNSKQTSWWKAKYTFSSICDTETPNTRYLPMSYYLEGTDANGARIYIYGAVKSLKVEADRDVTGVAPVDSVAWKMYFELVDCNWKQHGGTPGNNHVFKFVCSQQNDKCVFSTLVGNDGKAFNVFVSGFQLRLEPEPVTITSNVYRDFLHGDMRTQDNTALAKLSIHPGRDLMLSYLCRSLPLLDNTITWKKQNGNVLLLGAMSEDTQLPMEIHITSPKEPLNDNGDLFMAYPVYRTMIRYVTKPPDPGNMNPDSTAIKSIQFLLPNNQILAQNIKQKNVWVINDLALDKNATIDVLMLNKTPVKGGKNRKPGMTGGARPPKVEGVMHFDDFPGVRQGFSLISIGKRRQERLRSEPESASQVWNDLRVAKENQKITIIEVVREEKTKAIVVGGIVALIFGWKLANRSSISTLGKMTSYITFGSSFLSFVLGMLEYTERLPANYRPYEPVLFVFATFALLASMTVTLYASRFVPEVSCTFYLSILMAMIGLVMVLSFESSSPVAQAPATLQLKIALLFVLSSSLFLCAIELYKMSRKVSYDVNFVTGPLPSSVAGLPNLANMLMYGTILFLIVGLASLEHNSSPDKCDQLLFERNRANDNIFVNKGRENKEDIARKYFTEELQGLEGKVNECIASQYVPFDKLKMFSSLKYSDYIPVLLIAVPLFLNLSLPYFGKFISFSFPSRIDENGTNQIEDGRITRPAWFLKTFVGIAFVVFISTLLLPYAVTSPKICTHLKSMEQKNRDIVRENPLLYNKEYMSQVLQGESRNNCLSQEHVATTIVLGCIFVVTTMSLIAPAKKRFVPNRANATMVLTNLFYFVSVSSLLIWSYSSENRLKILSLF